MKRNGLFISILVFVSLLTGCKSNSTESTDDNSTLTYGGKTYNIVQIGSQYWLKENLNIGSMIQSSQGTSSNGIIEKYCYNNDSNNCKIYGGLYQWNEAMEYSSVAGAQGICPSGWHIPTVAEYTTLNNTVNNVNALKAIGQGTGTGTGTNVSGFSAMLAGWGSNNSNFYGLDSTAVFWTSTASDKNDAGS